MNEGLKGLYDRLVIAGWIENVIEKSESETVIMWSKGAREADHGQRKLIIFAMLYRELSKAGPISQQDLDLLVSMGLGYVLKQELPPP